MYHNMHLCTYMRCAEIHPAVLSDPESLEGLGTKSSGFWRARDEGMKTSPFIGFLSTRLVSGRERDSTV